MSTHNIGFYADLTKMIKFNQIRSLRMSFLLYSGSGILYDKKSMIFPSFGFTLLQFLLVITQTRKQTELSYFLFPPVYQREQAFFFANA